jgi:hypothetical protein
MTRYRIGVSILLVLIGEQCHANDPDEKLVRLIHELGGWYTRQDQNERGPIVSIGLSGDRVTNTVLKELAALDQLNTLNLTDSLVTDDGLANLVKMKRLEDLSLNHSKVTSECWKHIVAHEDLRVLSLSGTRLGNSGLTNVKKLKKLAVLQLDQTGVTDEGLREIGEAAELLHLVLGENTGSTHQTRSKFPRRD